jgi:hypothetical protein
MKRTGFSTNCLWNYGFMTRKAATSHLIAGMWLSG